MTWQLAYAYYLKAFAEMTFMSAKKQNIALKEDFDPSDGDFDAIYFERKAIRSINKCKQVLVIHNWTDSLLMDAISAMENQFN